VWVHDIDAWRNEDVDGSGNWTADFGVPGDEEGEETTADLIAGSNGNSNECDDDGDCTWAGWWVANPAIHVDPEGDWLWGEQWAPNSSVVITINDVDQPPMPVDEGGNFGEGWEPGDLDLAAGMVIDVTDGDTLKSHTVTGLVVTDVNETTDKVSGTATAGGKVHVWVHDIDAWRNEDVDGSGNWTADFGVPGDEEGEQTTADLIAGSNGNSNECDDDGDCTWAGWDIPGSFEFLSFEGPEEPLAFDQDAFVSASFIDPDQDEGHYVELDWGDGTVSEPIPIYEEGVGFISDSHLYGGPGIYELTVTVTDDTG